MLGHDAAQADHGRLAAERLQIGAHKAVGDLRQVAHVHVFGQRHAPAMDRKDLLAPVAVGNRDGDFAVEPAGPAQRRIQQVGQVGGGDDDQMLPLGQPVHKRQQLRHHALFHFADHVLAARRNGVDLVQKNDAGAFARGLLEDLAQMGLALAVELVDDLRAAHRIEIGLGFMGDGARDQRLAASRRAVQQDALGGVDPQPLEDLRIAQRQLDHLADALKLRLQPADVLVGHGARGPSSACCGLPITSRVVGLITTGPLGVVLPTLKSAQRLPNNGARMRAPFPHRQAVQQAPDIVHVALRGPDVGRGQHHALGRPANDFMHRYELIQSRPGVLPHQPVDLDARLPTHFLVRGHGFAHRLPLAGDLHRIADGDPEFFEVFRAHASDSPPDIPAQRLGDFEL